MDTVLAPASKVGSPGRNAVDRLSLLVVAPQELVQYGIRLMLSREGWTGRCTSARDTAGALAAIEKAPADIALIDVKLDGETAENSCLELRRAAPGMTRLLLTTNDYMPPRTVASMGAAGFICKGWTSAAIAETLVRVGAGQTQCAPRPDRGARHGLSPRQREMMQLVADGATNDQIARLLHLSASTVKQHTSAAYRKLGVRNRAAAIARARELSLL